MKEEGTTFLLQDKQGLIPQAARERKPVIINDVSAEPRYRPSPYLPDTRSEAVFPMMVGSELIGVLDLQSEEMNRFSESDIDILTSLAEQTAIAIRNAFLFERAEQARAEADQARARAEQADQIKSQFLASMSHELRTPLNAILSFNKLLAMGTFGDVNDEQISYLEKSLSSGRHLLSLINDVLDITKIQSGMMNLFIEEGFNVTEELDAVADSAEKMIGNKPVKLVRDIDPNLRPLTCDKRRVRQVILNLVSNAIKFTEAGVITLSAKQCQLEIMLAVMDTGPGIPEDQQEVIFDPFVQTETGIKHAGGTGLGLPISKSLVEAHGGCLRVESKLGEGAAFYVTLPQNPILRNNNDG